MTKSTFTWFSENSFAKILTMHHEIRPFFYWVDFFICLLLVKSNINQFAAGFTHKIDATIS
jgi:hypothetical protein